MTPRVSFIIAVYNQARYLPACLNSVVRQSITDWEAIVVDDGSNDGNVAAIVSELRDSRISLLAHDRNRGLAAARNTGIRSSRTAWFVALDADDELHPAFLETVLRASAEHPECDAIFTDFRWFGSISAIIKYQTQGLRDLLARRLMPGAGVLTRRQVWERVGGYCEHETLRICCQDHEFWVSAAELGLKTHHVPKALYRYRKHPESVSGRSSPYRYRAREFIYRKHKKTYDACGAAGRYLADGYWDSAHYRARKGNWTGAVAFGLRAALHGREGEDLRRLRQLLQWARRVVQHRLKRLAGLGGSQPP